MALTAVSDEYLARQVAEKAKLPPGSEIVPVREFQTSPRSACNSTELLSWMGSMTAGPPTLPAEVLRSAGAWAWIRYRWALEDRGEVVRPTAEARSIRKHTRALFSETVGVGAAGNLGCLHLMPSGFLAVANLDDVMEPLERSGVIRRRFGWGKKRPDYLIAGGLGGSLPFGSGPLELLALECKGTIKNEKAAPAQLAAGAAQVVGIESGLPLRRIVVATTLALDGNEPVVRAHAIEIVTSDRPPRPPDAAATRDAFLDTSLIRGLRIAGHFGQAERRLHGYETEPFEPAETFQFGEEVVAGRSVTVASSGVGLRAEIGFDLELLRGLEAPGPERALIVGPAVERLARRERREQRREEDAQEVRGELLTRDGVGIRVERAELPPQAPF